MVNSKSEFFSFREEKQNMMKGINKISDMSQTVTETESCL